MFGLKPKNGHPTATELREAYRRRLVEILGSNSADSSPGEAACSPFGPAPDVDSVPTWIRQCDGPEPHCKPPQKVGASQARVLEGPPHMAIQPLLLSAAVELEASDSIRRHAPEPTAPARIESDDSCLTTSPRHSSPSGS